MQHRRVAQRAARAVYGAIIALAVVAVLDESATSLEVIAAGVGGVIAAMLAEGYAEYIAAVIRQSRFPTRTEFVTEAKDVAAGALAAFAPLAPFMLSGIGVIDLSTAFDVAPWLGAAVIGTYVYIANRLAGLTGFWNYASVGFALLVAISLVALKALTH